MGSLLQGLDGAVARLVREVHARRPLATAFRGGSLQGEGDDHGRVIEGLMLREVVFPHQEIEEDEDPSGGTGG